MEPWNNSSLFIASTSALTVKHSMRSPGGNPITLLHEYPASESIIAGMEDTSENPWSRRVVGSCLLPPLSLTIEVDLTARWSRCSASWNLCWLAGRIRYPPSTELHNPLNSWCPLNTVVCQPPSCLYWVRVCLFHPCRQQRSSTLGSSAEQSHFDNLSVVMVSASVSRIGRRGEHDQDNTEQTEPN